ncbi:hypothetical protein [Methanosarcina sp. UBA5]|uniref:hypothetical protein n=1 Tax=Methanosarcina sp. UBA5 TaxID=1915593 RepID=UPI0025FCE2F2|nr:hypothetical protein [Methanosarcina sp. UBA5]
MFKFDYVEIPKYERFCEGCRKFEESEGRDSMYKVASFLVEYHWGKYADMADALGVLLLTWNAAFYRYGSSSLDFEELEKCINKNFVIIDSFRDRDISELSENDEQSIRKLFNDFNEALMINSGKKKGTKSPVSVAKALHLLAPKFFPLWDYNIAKAYRQNYSVKPEEKYIEFCKITKYMVESMKDYKINKSKSMIKKIDEYNYARYTKHWIE